MDYINGSDLLFLIGDNAVGHATATGLDISAEPKERAVKPLAANPVTAAMFKDRTITSMDMQISFEGLVYDSETEAGYVEMSNAMKAGQPVTVKGRRRKLNPSDNPEPFLEAQFVITSLNMATPAQDDATYSGQMQISGAPTVWEPSKINTTASE